MTDRERRFLSLARSALAAGARYAPPVSAARFHSLGTAADMGAVTRVRTSAAFAARFEADANASGLALDHARRTMTDTARKCRVCSAEVGLYDARCFNCQTALDVAEQAQADTVLRAEVRDEKWAAQVRAGTVPEARFARVLESRGLSNRPWRLLTADVSRWKSLA